jgi:hypothetical protein
MTPQAPTVARDREQVIAELVAEWPEFHRALEEVLGECSQRLRSWELLAAWLAAELAAAISHGYVLPAELHTARLILDARLRGDWP